MKKDVEPKKRATAKKKNIIVLKNSIDAENTVQMAKTLYRQITTTELSLNSLKIIDVYLSKINSHDASRKSVTFEKGELEKLFNVKYIRKEALEKHLNELLTITVLLSQEETNLPPDKRVSMDKGSLLLFDVAHLEQDENTQLWTVTIECSEKAKPLIFNIDKLGYLQHALQNSARLSKDKSFLLYKFLENNRNNKGTYPQIFEASLDNVKNALKVDKEAYDCRGEYGTLNNRILKVCQKEIQEKTDTWFDYEPKKKSRVVVGIKFTLYDRVKAIGETSVKVLDADNTAEKQANSVNIEANIIDDGAVNKELAYIATACDNEFTQAQITLLKDHISYYIHTPIQIYKYLRKMYLKLNETMKDGTTAERFLAFRELIDSDDELISYFESTGNNEVVQMSFEDITDNTPKSYYYGNYIDDLNTRSDEEKKRFEKIHNDRIAALAESCENAFSPEQMECIFELVSRIASNEETQCDYLRNMYLKMNAEGKIQNKFKYFCAMIENDAVNMV